MSVYSHSPAILRQTNTHRNKTNYPAIQITEVLLQNNGKRNTAAIHINRTTRQFQVVHDRAVFLIGVCIIILRVITPRFILISKKKLTYKKNCKNVK